MHAARSRCASQGDRLRLDPHPAQSAQERQPVHRAHRHARQGPHRSPGRAVPGTQIETGIPTERKEMIRSPLAALALAILAAAALPAPAQSDYPSKPVTMIVPFPPGGVADITGPPLAETLGR